MKTIEFLRKKALQRRLEDWKIISELLIMCSDGILSEKHIQIGWIEEDDMAVFLDEIFFDIDDMPVRDWLVKNFNVSCIESKWVQITSLK